ncbi:Gfo/Idh/MocA family oxidoreductase [Akkermansiaceae bacterium]|nr:Gfo/Idh/MocA family oxidoreductase [Akkermansiaceae bacterium]
MLGDLHYAEVDYYHGIGPWYGQYRWNTSKENGGSSLLSAGCHALDALLLCMGGEVEEVAVFELKLEIFQTMFMFNDGAQTWNGQFTGSKEGWEKAKKLLEQITKAPEAKKPETK